MILPFSSGTIFYSNELKKVSFFISFIMASFYFFFNIFCVFFFPHSYLFWKSYVCVCEQLFVYN